MCAGLKFVFITIQKAKQTRLQLETHYIILILKEIKEEEDQEEKNNIVNNFKESGQGLERSAVLKRL